MKSVSGKALSAALALIGSISPNFLVAEVQAEATECTVMRIAERYVAVHFPDFDSLRYPPIVSDKGVSWVVEYELPKDQIGGTPVVEIEKATLKVIRSFHTQ